jgi:hypothetical protein
MATDPASQLAEAGMDADSLYREEIYTDLKLGTLRVMVPVKKDGSSDSSRETVYTGEARLMTQMGPLPITFEIEAATLAEAVSKYGAAAKAGVEQALRELQELRRQASSSIVIPQGGALPSGGLGGGGLGGGGKIQLP